MSVTLTDPDTPAGFVALREFLAGGKSLTFTGTSESHAGYKRPLTTNRHSTALTPSTTSCTQQASIRQRSEPTPQSRVILQKLTVPQIVKKFRTLSGTQSSEPVGQFS